MHVLSISWIFYQDQNCNRNLLRLSLLHSGIHDKLWVYKALFYFLMWNKSGALNICGNKIPGVIGNKAAQTADLNVQLREEKKYCRQPVLYNITCTLYTLSPGNRVPSLIHCKKMLSTFPSPAGMSPNQSPWRGIIKWFPAGRVWLVTGRGREKLDKNFLQCRLHTVNLPERKMLLYWKNMYSFVYSLTGE